MGTKRTEAHETISDQRLRELVGSYNSQREFAKKVGLAPSYVTRLLMPSDNPHRKRIGNTVARRIEQRTGHPKYWLAGDDVVAREWPFRRIDRKRFDRLRDKEKKLVEAVVERMISAYEAERESGRKNGGGRRHVA